MKEEKPLTPEEREDMIRRLSRDQNRKQTAVDQLAKSRAMRGKSVRVKISRQTRDDGEPIHWFAGMLTAHGMFHALNLPDADGTHTLEIRVVE